MTFWYKDMPILAPYKADELYMRMKSASQVTVNAVCHKETHCSTKRPNIGGGSPAELEICFGTAENGSTNDMALLERIGIRGNSVRVCTVAQLNFAKSIRPIAIVNEDVVRFEI
jgi:hypothetical protein